MSILLTGGTGKSATPLARLLRQANKTVVLATRSGNVPPPFTGARFDWLDASTYNIPFEVDPAIDRVYLVAPRVVDMLTPMKAFIDFAIQKGVKRFVLISAGMIEAGGPGMGLVHEYLASLTVEYCALRPSWFFDNLLLSYSNSIRTSNEIVTAAEDGLIGHISTEDIADVAFKALTDDVIEMTQPILVGPELLSYDQIANMLSEVLGRKIKHKRVPVEEYKEVLMKRGQPEGYAQIMSATDVLIAGGAEEKLFHRADFVGRRRLQDYLEANKNSKEWRPEDR